MTDKQSLAEMRKELRELRKQYMKPVSKLKKADISAEIEKMKVRREETPAIASTEGIKPKKMKPAVESIKEAKKNEFPMVPTMEKVSKGKVEKMAKEAPKKKSSKLARLMEMVEAMSSDEDYDE